MLVDSIDIIASSVIMSTVLAESLESNSTLHVLILWMVNVGFGHGLKPSKPCPTVVSEILYSVSRCPLLMGVREPCALQERRVFI